METSATTIVVPPTAEEQRIASIADSINLADPSLTVTYGTEAMQGISRFADDLLSRVQALSLIHICVLRMLLGGTRCP